MLSFKDLSLWREKKRRNEMSEKAKRKGSESVLFGLGMKDEGKKTRGKKRNRHW